MTEITDLSEVLPGDDCMFHEDKYPDRIVYRVGAELQIILNNFRFPEHYTPRIADLLLRLPAGYPNAAPDMFWTRPDVKLASGAWPQRSNHHEVPGAGQKGADVHEGRSWQRWSRHFQGGWRVGQHGLRSYVATIVQELNRGV